MPFIRFLQDKQGSVVPTFALSTIAVFGFVGAALDYSRGNSTKAAIQAALDATGLILSHEAEKIEDQTALKQKATDYFKAQFTRPEARDVQVDATLTSPQERELREFLQRAAGQLDTIQFTVEEVRQSALEVVEAIEAQLASRFSNS